MTSYVPPIKNGASGWIGYVRLTPRTPTGQFQSNPTLATGDVKVSIDGAALANLGTLPVVTPASSDWVKVTLAQAEVNGDNILVQFKDAAGAEWCDDGFTLQTVARQIDDLATPTNITAGTIATVTTLTNLPAITANWLTAAGIAASALNGKGDWNIGKTGYALSAAGVQAIWDALTSALTTVGSVGKLLVDNLNATISSRMATYTQPTGFLAATFPSGTIANTTNITAGAITSVGTLTTYTGNTPQTGDAFARLGAPAGASVSADVLQVKNYVDDIGVAGAGLTALGDTRLANLDAAMTTRATPAQVATELGTYDAPTNTEMVAAFTQIKGATWAATDTLEAIRDRGDAAWITATGFSTHSAADVWAVATRALTDKAGFALSSTGLALQTAWTVNLTGNLSGSVGSVTGLTASNLDAAVSTRMPTTHLAATAGKLDGVALADTVTTYTGNTKQTADVATLITTVGVAGAGLTAADDDTLAAIAALNNLSSADVTAAVPTANVNADALLDRANAIETGITPRGALRIAGAVLAGKVSGGQTGIETFRNIGDTKDRVVSTNDATGNRTAVTVDGT